MDTNNHSLRDRTDIISVIVPSFLRYDWLERLVVSLHKYADYPFELIINDDGSYDGTTKLIQERLFDKITLLIHNCRTGKNQGMCTAINRMVSCATSKYIVMLNADHEIQRPFFRDTINILNKEYVGATTLLNAFFSIDDVAVYLESNGTKFTLQEGLGQGSAIAYRKNVYEEVGGLQDYISLASDCPFLFSIWKHGYFTGRALLNNITEPYMIDNSLLYFDKQDTTLSHADGHFPKYFNVKDEELLLADSNRAHFLGQNTNNCDFGSTVTDHICNAPYWVLFMTNLLQGPFLNCGKEIDWELAKKYGQDKFRDEIEKDIIIKTANA